MRVGLRDLSYGVLRGVVIGISWCSNFGEFCGNKTVLGLRLAFVPRAQLIHLYKVRPFVETLGAPHQKETTPLCLLNAPNFIPIKRK